MLRCLPAVVLLLLSLTKTGLCAEDVRTWTDVTGQFKVQARWVSQDATSVRLRLEDGQTIEVALEKLSDADRQFLRQREESKRPLYADPAVRKLADAALAIYTFDPSEAATDPQLATDISKHELPGEIHGATSVRGIAGQALSFDGSDDYVVSPKLMDLLRQNRSSLSVSLWIRRPISEELV